MSDMFIRAKLGEMKEQLDRIEQMLKEQQKLPPGMIPASSFTGAPAQREFNKQELMPKLQVKVEKKK